MARRAIVNETRDVDGRVAVREEREATDAEQQQALQAKAIERVREYDFTTARDRMIQDIGLALQALLE